MSTEFEKRGVILVYREGILGFTQWFSLYFCSCEKHGGRRFVLDDLFPPLPSRRAAIKLATGGALCRKGRILRLS